MKQFRFKNLPELPTLIREDGPEGRRYVTPTGVRLPSITTVLGAFGKEYLPRWRRRVGEEEANRISKRSSASGTTLHNILETYVGNDQKNLLSEQDYHTIEAFNTVRPLVDRIDNVHYLEAKLFSELIGVAGTVDCIAEFDGVPSVIDYKTSSKPKKEEWIQNYFEQCTAYSLMYQDMVGIRIPQIAVIIAVDDEEPQLFIRNRSDYVESLYEKIKTYKSGNL